MGEDTLDVNVEDTGLSEVELAVWPASELSCCPEVISDEGDEWVPLTSEKRCMPAPELTSVAAAASERVMTVSVRLRDASCNKGAIEAKESEERS